MGTKFGFRTTQMEWDAGGGTTWVDMGHLYKVRPLNPTREVINVTHADSPDGYIEKIVKTFRDGGQITLGLYLDKTDYAAILADFNVDVASSFRVSFPLVGAEATPSRIVSQGFIVDPGILENSKDDSEAWQCEITIEVTGKPVFTPGS